MPTRWLLLLLVGARAEFAYTDLYAAGRSDYYLRRAAAAPPGSHSSRRLLEAAVEISPGNETVLALASSLGLPAGAGTAPLAPASLQLGPTRTWDSADPGADCPIPAGVSFRDVFATPFGFTHLSEVGLSDPDGLLRHLRKLSVGHFKKAYKRAQKESRDGGAKFTSVNNAFFKMQRTNPRDAMENQGEWPKMYQSPEYKEWAAAAHHICTSYIRKLGVSLSTQEEEDMELVLWAAVYPQIPNDIITHLYHAHQESIVSFVLFVSMPEPATPLTVADPRGAPPIEDFEWFQNLGDLGVDAEPPFHRTLEVFPGEGDIVIFPSFAIHKVPPHFGSGTRVAWPCNCHLPKGVGQRRMENPLDGWERIARWPSGVAARARAAPAYLVHARAAVELARAVEDPYMKLWEAQNQVVALLQFGHGDPQAWLDAGAVAARIAVILAARSEGDYFADAVAMWARALRLDPSAKDRLPGLLSELAPAQPPPELEDGYIAAKRWVEEVRSWGGRAPPDEEFVQFLHPELNGPGKCVRMCNGTSAPSIQQIVVLPLFGTRVFTLAAGLEQRLPAVARELLGPAAAAASVELEAAPPEGCWHRNAAASLSGVACDGAAEVWFADPRGVWPGRWAGALPSGAAQEAAPVCTAGALGSEPKAPFHWHAVLTCSLGEVLLFPAWLAYQVPTSSRAAVRHLSVRVPAGGGEGEAVTTQGWRLPVVHPRCRSGLGEAAGPSPQRAAGGEQVEL